MLSKILSLFKSESTPKDSRKQQHQVKNSTSYNRYPEIFQHVSDMATQSHWKNPSVLSFGCSSGEELKSLYDLYFPFGQLTGVDFSSDMIKLAKQKYAKDPLQFYESKHFDPTSKYDIIFCMSVLCSWPDTRDLESCEDVYPFVRFDEVVREMDALLNENGILIIYNSNFRFTDTETSKKYHPIEIPGYMDSGFVHKFDNTNKRVDSHYPYSVFRKTIA